jgi:hypothetical protein
MAGASSSLLPGQTEDVLAHLPVSSTHYMNRFRKQGYMNYSRQGISLNRDTFKTILERTGYASAVD